MTVSQLVQALPCTVFHLADGQGAISGVYCGDLLSWVMGRAEAGQVWCTIMSNQNVAAVAALNDLAAVLLTEGVKPDEALLEKAKAQQITLLGTTLSTYAAANALHAALSRLDTPLSSPNFRPEASLFSPNFRPEARLAPPSSDPFSTQVRPEVDPSLTQVRPDFDPSLTPSSTPSEADPSSTPSDHEAGI